MRLDLKYRPKKFSEILGQDLAVEILQKLISQNDVPNVIVFNGPTASGKTSLARLVAKSLLCDEPSDKFCDLCPSCRDFDQGQHSNFIEINAASRGLVEDARKLEEEVAKFTVNTSKNKRVYVLDEAHMLTKQAQNALLKLFEEGSPSVYFLLTTTEPDKLLPTLCSRSFQLPLRLVDNATLLKKLQDVCSIENVKYEEPALRLIVACCGGRVRDAIKSLDHLSVFGDISFSLTKSYLKFDLNAELLKILALAKIEVQAGLSQLTQLLEREAPVALSRRMLNVLMQTEKLRLGINHFETDLEKLYASQLIERWGEYLPEALQFWLDSGIRQTREQVCCDYLLFCHKLISGNFQSKDIRPTLKDSLSSSETINSYQVLKDLAFNKKSTARQKEPIANTPSQEGKAEAKDTVTDSVKQGDKGLTVEDYVNIFGGKIIKSPS